MDAVASSSSLTSEGGRQETFDVNGESTFQTLRLRVFELLKWFPL